MPHGQVTVTSQFPLQQVVYGDSDNAVPVLLVNTDPAVTIFLADTFSAEASDSNRVTPLPPQSSLGYDGTQDVFASTASGLTAVMNIYPSGTQYFAQQGITKLFGNGGLQGGGNAGLVKPSTPLNVISMVDVTGFASYDISLFAQCVSPGALLAPVTTQVNLVWFDDPSGVIPVFQETWYIWNGRVAPPDSSNATFGSGPMHGRYMSVTLFVPLNALSNVVLQYINIYGSNRVVPYSDWRQNGAGTNPNVNGITVQGGGGTGYDNIIASITGAVLSLSQAVFVPLALFAGPVWYRYQGSIAALHDPVIAQVAATLGGQWGVGTAMSGVLVNLPADTLDHSGTIILPRSPCAFIVQAPAAGNFTFSLEMSAQQAALRMERQDVATETEGHSAGTFVLAAIRTFKYGVPGDRGTPAGTRAHQAVRRERRGERYHRIRCTIHDRNDVRPERRQECAHFQLATWLPC